MKLPMSKGRATHAKQRLREVPDLTRWAAAIRRAAASPFCRGDNDRAWLADIDFLLRPDTLAKIEEGKYDPRGKGVAPVKQTYRLPEVGKGEWNPDEAQRAAIRAMRGEDGAE